MINNETIKALEWLIFNFPKIENPKDDTDKICNCINLYCQNAIDELNRQKAEIERLQKLQKPTDSGGFKIENGKVIFYSNMLNGYRHEYKDLDEIVKELNLYMHMDYKNIELISHYKHNAQNAKSEAIKEYHEKVKQALIGKGFYPAIVKNVLEEVEKEMVGD